jgi:hypothetical protein
MVTGSPQNTSSPEPGGLPVKTKVPVTRVILFSALFLLWSELSSLCMVHDLMQGRVNHVLQKRVIGDVAVRISEVRRLPMKRSAVSGESMLDDRVVTMLRVLGKSAARRNKVRANGRRPGGRRTEPSLTLECCWNCAARHCLLDRSENAASSN